MPHAKTIVKGTSIVFAMTIVGTIIGYMLRLFIAHNLSVAEYGLFYGVMAFIGIFTIFGDLSLRSAVVKFIPDFIIRNEFGKIKSMITLITIIQLAAISAVMGGIIFFANSIAIDIFGTTSAAIVIQLVALSSIISVVFNLYQAVFQGFQKPALYASMDPARTSIVFIITAVLISMGAMGIAAAYVIAALAVIIAYTLPFFRLPIIKNEISIIKPLFVQIWLYTLPVLAGSVVSIAMSYMDTILLVILSGTYFAGLYQAALPTSQLLLVFASSITAVILPAFSEMWAKNEKDKIGTGLGYILIAVFLFVIPLVLGMLALADNIIVVLFGGKFFGAINILRILVIGTFFSSLLQIFNISLQAIGKPYLSAYMLAATAAITIVLNIALVPVLQGIGTAIAMATAYFAGFMISLNYLRRYFTIRIFYKKVVKIIAASLIAMATIFAAKELIILNDPLIESVISGLFGVLVYAIAIVYIRVIGKSDVEMLKNMGIKVPLANLLNKILR